MFYKLAERNNTKRIGLRRFFEENDYRQLDTASFERFLEKAIAFITAYSMLDMDTSDFRVPIDSEMKNIVNGREIEFTNSNLYHYTNKN